MLKIYLLGNEATTHIWVSDVVLVAVDPARSNDLALGVILRFLERYTTPDFITKVPKFLLHSESDMSHREFLIGVLIFVRLFKDEIHRIDAPILVLQPNF